MRDKIEFEIICEDLSLESGKLMLNAGVYLDHVNKHGEKGDSIFISTPFDLIEQLKGTFGVDPEFAPYDRIVLVNALSALEKLEKTCASLCQEVRDEISLMDRDPDYFNTDDDEEEEEE